MYSATVHLRLTGLNIFKSNIEDSLYICNAVYTRKTTWQPIMIVSVQIFAIIIKRQLFSNKK